MPYSIFFTDGGVAVHGTFERRSLGRAVSHGCVRLSVKNAATLWKLVMQQKMANTSIVVTGDAVDDQLYTGRRRSLDIMVDPLSTGRRHPLY